ncbi:MAG TPA: hypothetical protein VI381_06505 [Allosphingosinicella sp.]
MRYQQVRFPIAFHVQAQSFQKGCLVDATATFVDGKSTADVRCTKLDVESSLGERNDAGQLFSILPLPAARSLTANPIGSPHWTVPSLEGTVLFCLKASASEKV